MFENYPDIVTVDDLQAMLKIGRTYAYEIVKKGIIPSVKVGRFYRIPKIYVIKYILGEVA